METNTGPIQMQYMVNIKEHGNLHDLPNTEFKLHPDADLDKGGLLMKDPDNIIPQAFKDIASKIGKNMVKGQITDISKTPAPSYLHHPYS